MISLDNIRLAVIGLGYVGLPLAIEFGKKRPVVGFDINPIRISQLRAGVDTTLEVVPSEIKCASKLKFSTEVEDLQSCNCFIVTVPTPIDQHKQPDLSPLLKASQVVGQLLKPGDIVIYESTVYPGCTEDDCVPVLEKFSGLNATGRWPGGLPVQANHHCGNTPGIEYPCGGSGEGDRKHTT